MDCRCGVTGRDESCTCTLYTHTLPTHHPHTSALSWRWGWRPGHRSWAPAARCGTSSWRAPPAHRHGRCGGLSRGRTTGGRPCACGRQARRTRCVKAGWEEGQGSRHSRKHARLFLLRQAAAAQKDPEVLAAKSRSKAQASWQATRSKLASHKRVVRCAHGVRSSASRSAIAFRIHTGGTCGPNAPCHAQGQGLREPTMDNGRPAESALRLEGCLRTELRGLARTSARKGL